MNSNNSYFLKYKRKIKAKFSKSIIRTLPQIMTPYFL